MDLQEIQDKLSTFLSGTERKIVFWYDDNGAYEEDIDGCLCAHRVFSMEHGIGQVSNLGVRMIKSLEEAAAWQRRTAWFLWQLK